MRQRKRSALNESRRGGCRAVLFDFGGTLDAEGLPWRVRVAEGNRLRQAGWATPKPLVQVAGVPLIEWVIRKFVAARVTPVVVIVNARDGDCVDRVRGRFPGVDLRFIVKTTASSLESFVEVARSLGPGRSLISTVDAWCQQAEFVGFVQAALSHPAAATVLAVTPFVADEHPLWARVDDAGRITELGGASGEMVTAGMYLLSERVRTLAPPPELGRLRDFLAWLARRGEPLFGEVIPTVVDVDRAEDVALAAALARAGAAAANPRGGLE